MKKFSSKNKSLLIIGLTSLILVGLPLGIWAINTQADGFQTTTSFIEVRAHGDCRLVRHTGNQSFFIPTRTKDEAFKVLNNPPAGMVVQPCGGSGGKK